MKHGDALKERNSTIFEMAMSNRPMGEIAVSVGVSESRIRQILTRYQRRLISEVRHYGSMGAAWEAEQHREREAALTAKNRPEEIEKRQAEIARLMRHHTENYKRNTAMLSAELKSLKEELLEIGS